MIGGCLPGSSLGVAQEYKDALRDFQSIAHEYGNPVVVYLRDEGDVSRDPYQSVKNRPGQRFLFKVNATTIHYQPTAKYLEKAGIRESCDVTITMAMQDWIDAGYQFDDIDPIRTTVTILALPSETNGTDYRVVDKARANEYANGYLGVTLALRRL